MSKEGYEGGRSNVDYWNIASGIARNVWDEGVRTAGSIARNYYRSKFRARAPVPSGGYRTVSMRSRSMRRRTVRRSRVRRRVGRRSMGPKRRARAPMRRYAKKSRSCKMVRNSSILGNTLHDVESRSWQLNGMQGNQTLLVVPFLSTSDMLRIWQQTSNTTYGSASASTARIRVGGMKASCMVTNSSLTNAIVDVYHVTYRVAPSLNVTTWDPIAAWQAGVADASGTSGNEGQINCLPTDSVLFKRCFFLKSKKSMVLGQGETANIPMNVGFYKSLLGETVNRDYGNSPQDTSHANANTGYTQFLLFVLRGTPSSSAESVTTTTAPKLDIVTIQRTTSNAMRDWQDEFHYQDNLLSPVTPLNIVSVGGGDVVPNQVT